MSDLPDRGTTRWVAERKAKVVKAVNSGLMSASEAKERYQLSTEELLSWQRAVDCNGVPGLRVKMTQATRDEQRTARRRDRVTALQFAEQLMVTCP